MNAWNLRTGGCAMKCDAAISRAASLLTELDVENPRELFIRLQNHGAQVTRTHLFVRAIVVPHSDIY